MTKTTLKPAGQRLLARYGKEKQAILGLGLENQALLKLFDRYRIKSAITICDSRNQAVLEPIVASLKLKSLKLDYQLGQEFNRRLEKYQYLWRAPGWPISCPGIQAALRNGSRLESPMNLFFALCPSRNIIGVTGTKGKGTTSSLIYAILKASKKRAWLGGNIGIAPLAFVDRIRSQDFVVLELSSFQLEDLRHSPKFSIITNIYKEHLAPADPLNPNYHKNFKAYLEAKLNIARFQKKDGRLLLNRKFKNVFSDKKTGAGRIFYFDASDTESRLYGIFNRENIAAAELIGKILRLPAKTVASAIKHFNGLEHRLELVREQRGVRWFDNSFSTTPESSILDLQSFKGEPIILVAGGADKGADFKAFAKAIAKHATHLFLFPGTGSDRLAKELKAVSFPDSKISNSSSMADAVNGASAIAPSPAVVLLSTGCASFGLFKNYKDRGNQFKEAVHALK